MFNFLDCLTFACIRWHQRLVYPPQLIKPTTTNATQNWHFQCCQSKIDKLSIIATELHQAHHSSVCVASLVLGQFISAMEKQKYNENNIETELATTRLKRKQQKRKKNLWVISLALGALFLWRIRTDFNSIYPMASVGMGFYCVCVNSIWHWMGVINWPNSSFSKNNKSVSFATTTTAAATTFLLHISSKSVLLAFFPSFAFKTNFVDSL